MLYSIHAKVEEELDHLVQEGINERISIVVIGYTKSEDYMVINTQRGIFRYNRLPFGNLSAPGIFQRSNGEYSPTDSYPHFNEGEDVVFRTMDCCNYIIVLSHISSRYTIEIANIIINFTLLHDT